MCELTCNRQFNCERHGFALLEATAAVAMLAVLLTTSVQVIALMSAEQKAAERRAIAVEAVQNLVEQVESLPWEQVTAQAADRLALPEAVQAALPDAKITVAANNETEPVAVKRVTVELSWQTKASRPVRAGPHDHLDISRYGGAARIERLSMNDLRTESGIAEEGRRRRAFSIVEMLVVIALTSFIFGLTITFIREILITDRKLRDRPTTVEQFARLADGLRADVRRASNVQRTDEKRLEIQFSETGRAVYELTDGGCRRSSVPIDAAGAKSDFYSIGKAGAWQIELKPAAQHELVEITLRGDLELDQRPQPPFWVVSALGVDRAAGGNNE